MIKKLRDFNFEDGLTKKVYREGDALSLKGATLRVHYKDGQADPTGQPHQLRCRDSWI